MDAATAALINNLPEEFLPRRRPARACVAAAKQKLEEEAREEREERLRATREAKDRAAAKKAARSAKKVAAADRLQENLGEHEENDGPDGPGVEDEDLSAGLDPEIYELRCMWELASILNFLNVYKDILNIPIAFDATELESALLEPLAPSLLKDLHIALLKGVPPVPKNLDRSTWAYDLFRKLKDKWWQFAGGGSPITPAIPKGEEDAAYDQLSPRDRVRILKALCEMRNDQDDCRDAMEQSIKIGVMPESVQLQATGWDSKNRTYWYEDNYYAGTRLYRETRTRGGPKRGIGIHALEPEPGKWETVCAQVDDFKRVAERFASSGNRKEQRLGKFIRDELLAELEEKERQREKRLRRQQRQAENLQILLSGPGLAFGRSKRERKQVDYSYDDYDQVIRDATRKGARHSSPPRRFGRENGHASGQDHDPYGARRSERHRRPGISASGAESGGDAGLDSDAAERRSHRERRPSNRVTQAQETMQAVADQEEDAQPLGEVVYDDEKRGQVEAGERSESEELPDAGAQEDKDDEEYMGSNEEDEEEDEDEEDFDPEDEDGQRGGRKARRQSGARSRYREDFGSGESDGDARRPARGGLRQKERKRYRDGDNEDDSDADLDALLNESDHEARGRKRHKSGGSGRRPVGRRKTRGEEWSEEDGGGLGGPRRPTREKKQVDYAKLDDVELEEDEENGAAQQAVEEREGPYEHNGGSDQAQEDRDGGRDAAGESSGEDSELYAGEPTPKQYGQPDHETNSLRPAQRGRIDAYPNGSEAEEEERLGGARVDVGEELEALEVLGKLVKGHGPKQAHALPSSGNEEVSEYEPEQSGDEASEEDGIDEYDD
ncbi:hypothetical protein KFL_002260080 [Klebsormidium nitens]|uniref:DDT domain-containing protein n=1 Tax=Klebsormidium nitens TaxID=105231 RepID=A0A1Y1I5M1_KLENI|nr:hypothetical protein KFL_002260080 [Klebsormidium nitens]|eukprot:GAQ85252.1 hypothetical protein KFL_002260080 [Klebsormidium nitens]